MVETFVEHSADDFMKYSPARLKVIRLQCKLAIQAAKQGIEEGDPRAKRALAHYRREMRQINLAYQAQVYGEEGPPPVSVELESLGLFAQAGKI